ncbi:glycosyltransferase [bacterium]|nr:glycosyltransferase [bacterium]
MGVAIQAGWDTAIRDAFAWKKRHSKSGVPILDDFSMNFLFIHPNFPAQTKHLLKHLAQNPAHDVRFICNPKATDIPGVTKIPVPPVFKGNKIVHRYVKEFEAQIFRGQQIARLCSGLKRAGYKPDIIWVHPGWGDALFLKDVFPEVPLISYGEFYYRSFGADMHFDPSDPIELDTVARIRTKNAHLLLALEAADQIVAPTAWQKSLHPREFHSKISIIHEGIDCKALCPTPLTSVQISSALTLGPQDEVITFIARKFERYRGFPTFMYAIEEVLKKRPAAHAVVIGSDGIGYGSSKDRHLRQDLMKKLKIPNDRLHFPGTVDYQKMIDILRISKAHVYLTYPFVLSWSMLEAMSIGCIVIGSSTPPVQEVIEDNKNGFLVDFFYATGLAEKIEWVLDHQEDCKPIRERARETIFAKFNVENSLMEYDRLFENLLR